MKMNRFFMGASLCALMLTAVGCGSDNDMSDNGKTPDGKVIINATAGIKNIGDTDAAQRVALGGTNGVSPLWETSDQIAVKVDGGTADALTLSSGANSQNGVFSGSITPASGTTMTAYYPASAATATDLTTQTGTVAAAAKASVMFATASYSTSPHFSFANKTSILSFNMPVPDGFNTSGTLTATVSGAYSKGTLGTDGSWGSTEASDIAVSGITVSNSTINGYVVVIPGSHVNVLSIVVSDGTKSFETAAYTSTSATIAANQIISISKTLSEKATYEYVDLGLSVNWATTNIGATNPEDYGDYFAWGETTGYNDATHSFEWANYTFGANKNALTKYNTTDGIMTLEAADDAATVNWGSPWRMPTQTELAELMNSCNKTTETVNGIAGYRFTSTKKDYTDKSIFIPKAGTRKNAAAANAGVVYMWSSTRGNATYYYCGCPMYSNSSDAFYCNNGGSGNNRCYGYSVRPVRAK